MEEKSFDELYPEHAKLNKVREKSQWLGEFIDWADNEGMHLYQRITDENDDKRTTLVRVPHGIRELLGKFLKIDPVALDREKDLIFENLRKSEKERQEWLKKKNGETEADDQLDIGARVHGR